MRLYSCFMLYRICSKKKKKTTELYISPFCLISTQISNAVDKEEMIKDMQTLKT